MFHLVLCVYSLPDSFHCRSEEISATVPCGTIWWKFDRWIFVCLPSLSYLIFAVSKLYLKDENSCSWDVRCSCRFTKISISCWTSIRLPCSLSDIENHKRTFGFLFFHFTPDLVGQLFVYISLNEVVHCISNWCKDCMDFDAL